MNSEILKSVAEILALILFIAITRYLIPYLKSKYDFQKTENIFDMINAFVKYAEQTHEQGEGEVKKAEVLTNLINAGVKITPRVEAQIEAAVYDLAYEVEMLDEENES
ncbi:MAG: phage holin family protein [Oscillospiraceae bacterium]|jgi:hypothetical protein|nr:phage holin family protein [Oscillospiraceae bacterium]